MTYDEYYKKIYGQGTAQVKTAQDALDVQANANRDLINATADQNIADINTVYGTQIADAKEAAEIAHRKNEMQFSANERYLERKAAEMGHTGSGLNRTQMTANMLSHGNQGYEIDRQKQKTVDTLAAAMASKVAAENTTRNSSLAGIDSQLAIDKAKVESDWRDTAAAEATKLYEKDKENAAKYTTVYDKSGNVTRQYKTEDFNNDFTGLWNTLKDETVNRGSDDEYKLGLVDAFVQKYDIDVDGTHMSMLLNAAGVTPDDYKNFINGTYGINGDNGITATVEGFKTRSGDNFVVKINDKSYNVENQGKASSNTKSALDSLPAYGDIKILNGKAYYKHTDGNYYKLGKLEGFLNLGTSSESGYADLMSLFD